MKMMTVVQAVACAVFIGRGEAINLQGEFINLKYVLDLTVYGNRKHKYWYDYFEFSKVTRSFRLMALRYCIKNQIWQGQKRF